MGEDKDGGAGRESWSKRQDQHRTDFEKPPSALGPRVGAWVLWLVGLALEASCVLYATGVIAIPGVELPAWLVVAVALVLDLVLVLVAASLWKKAARRAFQAGAAGVSAGASKVGVIMTSVAFIPMLAFFASAKNADRKTVGTAAVLALVVVAALVACALLFGGEAPATA